MNHRLLKIGAVAAVIGALAVVTATVLEPDSSGESGAAIRIVAGSGIWHFDRALDLIGGLLTVGALTVVGRTFTGRSAKEWARVGQPFLVLMFALGASAIATGATVKNLADAWATAGPEAKPAYLAAFYAARQTTDNLFFCAFLALGLYLATLAAAILTQGVYARWIGWASAASALLVLCGNLLVLAADAAFLAVLAGYAIFNVVLAALGLTLWRHAPHWASTALEQDAAVGPTPLARG
jgi:hypothetical protein